MSKIVLNIPEGFDVPEDLDSSELLAALTLMRTMFGRHKPEGWEETQQLRTQITEIYAKQQRLVDKWDIINKTTQRLQEFSSSAMMDLDGLGILLRALLVEHPWLALGIKDTWETKWNESNVLDHRMLEAARVARGIGDGVTTGDLKRVLGDIIPSATLQKEHNVAKVQEWSLGKEDWIEWWVSVRGVYIKGGNVGGAGGYEI